MKLIPRRLPSSAVILAAAWLLVPTTGLADLLPPESYNGKTLEQWTLDWGAWAIKTDVGGQTLPDTVDGVRYAPPIPTGLNEFVAELTVQHGTAVVFSPFIIYGEHYEDGSEDLVSAIEEFMLFETTMIDVKFDGNSVLKGMASAFPDRKTGVRYFADPVTYLVPQDRGGINAVAAVFEQGIGTMFVDLSVGEHTITNVSQSEFFGDFSATYNITVVPEPSTASGMAIAGLLVARRYRRRTMAGSV